MQESVAEVVFVTGTTTISCSKFLGIYCQAGGPMLADLGDAADATKRVAQTAVGTAWQTNFPISTDQQLGLDKGKITVSGMTQGAVFVHR